MFSNFIKYMVNKFVNSILGYEHLVDCSMVAQISPEYAELSNIGADKIYFSGEFPAIFFKSIDSFNDSNLITVADIQHKAWNYRKVMFLIVTSSTEIRVYNCYQKPKYINPNSIIDKELEDYEIIRASENDEKNIKILTELFSRIGVDSGLLWTSNYDIRNKINIQNRIDKYLVKSLLETAAKLKEDIKDINIIHGLLMRSLFILYLEDKGAAKQAGLYSEIKKNAESYFDILDDVEATYALFDKLQNHFNGNVFPVVQGEKQKITIQHLKTIKKCFIDGDTSNNPKLFENWRIFKFDFIQIELLSEVYENFLGEFKSKKEKGQYYTPYTLVELILNDKLPIKNSCNYNTKILDPACGSGIFLVEGYKRLIRRWQNANLGESISFKVLKEILTNNIFGIEIDPLAIKVTAFSLYLALVEQLNPKTLWIDQTNKFPYLINNPNDNSIVDKQGCNLWCRDTIGEINPDNFVKVNLVVGNPPFGTKKILNSIMQYCTKYSFGKEMVLPFMHKAMEFCPEGDIALIFNSKVLTNTEKPFQTFRKWLFADIYVEKIYNLSIFRKIPKNFGGQLFTSAVGPICIAYYRKEIPTKPSRYIEYWAPKTYIKSNLIDGVVIDSTDIKFLPRTECMIPSTKIWKIAMWGNISDFQLFKSLSDNTTLSTFLDDINAKRGLGLQYIDDSTKKINNDIDIPQRYILPKHIERYVTDRYSTLAEGLSTRSKELYSQYYGTKINELSIISDFRRLGAKESYNAPHVLIKEGLKNWKICASYIDENCSFNSKVLGIHYHDEKILKGITCYLNSKLATYFLFMISASIGIEREEIKPNEYYQLPFSIKPKDLYILSDILDKYRNFDFLRQKQIEKQFEEEIDNLIFDLFEISQQDRMLIEDAMNYSFSILIEGGKSRAFKPVSIEDSKDYASILCGELNDFYQDSQNSINARVYDIASSQPLNLVVLQFSQSEKDIEINISNDLVVELQKLDKYALEKKGKNIYIQKMFRYYDSNAIYLIKPNQKRFWTRSQAVDDALSLITEISKMSR